MSLPQLIIYVLTFGVISSEKLFGRKSIDINDIYDL